MDARDAIKMSLDLGDLVTNMYLGDMTDEELMVRPHPDCNHTKWQLGHLIASENKINNDVVPGCMPELPEGFAARYTAETSKSDDPAAFDSKEELLRLYKQQREATLAALAKLSNDDLAQKSPEEMQSYAPTVAAAFNLHGGHHLMHSGQWAVIRRSLGRPPLM